MRAPSWGFVYLAAVTAGCVAFLIWVSGEFWFQRPDPRARLEEESAYVYALAKKSDDAQRWTWLNQALRGYLTLGDRDRVIEILDTLAAAAVAPSPGPEVEGVWIGGRLGEWTTGERPLLILARRSPEKRSIVRCEGRASAERAVVRRGDGRTESLRFEREGERNIVRFPLELDGTSGFELTGVLAKGGVRFVAGSEGSR